MVLLLGHSQITLRESLNHGARLPADSKAGSPPMFLDTGLLDIDPQVLQHASGADRQGSLTPF
jgi:hypothetical protein